MPRTWFWKKICSEESEEGGRVHQRDRGAKRSIKKIGKSDFQPGPVLLKLEEGGK